MSITSSKTLLATPLAYRLVMLGAALLIGALMAPSAHAQWAVNDKDANTKLKTANQTLTTIKENLGDKIKGATLNDNLDLIRQKMAIGNFVDKRPGDRVEDPQPAFPKASDAKLIDGYASCNGLAQAQQTNCQKIIDIQNAQYKFMVTMYETSATRNQVLKDIIADRKNIAADDPNSLGKIEENTNQLTALYNLIALDQQQMQTVNYAYDANLKFLRDEQARLSRAANTGKSADQGGITLPGGGTIDPTSVISGLAAGSVLKEVLGKVQSDKPDGLQTLHVTDGW